MLSTYQREKGDVSQVTNKLDWLNHGWTTWFGAGNIFAWSGMKKKTYHSWTEGTLLRYEREGRGTSRSTVWERVSPNKISSFRGPRHHSYMGHLKYILFLLNMAISRSWPRRGRIASFSFWFSILTTSWLIYCRWQGKGGGWLTSWLA